MYYLAQIKHTNIALHGCDVADVEPIPVTLAFWAVAGLTQKVKAFGVAGHLKDKRCFTRGYHGDGNNGKLDVMAALEFSPVNKLQTAVNLRAANYARKAQK